MSRSGCDGPWWVVLPAGDPDAPSGGDRYDRQVCDRLPVHEIAVPGAWPRPSRADVDRLDRALAAVPDGAVVLLDGLVACGVPDVIAAHARRLRLAVLVHLPLAAETGLPAQVAARLDAGERAVLHAVDAVLATSASAARDLVGRHGLDPARVHAVPPGTDPAPLARAGGGSRLLCLAAVVPRKGHDLLVDALATVGGDWSCVCVGALRDPDWADRLRGAIARHGLDSRIRLSGPRTGAALEATWAGCDLLVLPSRAETFGMVVTEALARGIPVLATAVDALPATLGRTPAGALPGMLVPPDDPVALAAALRRWLHDAGLRDELRAAARARRAQLGGWDGTARGVQQVLRGVRGDPAPGGPRAHPRRDAPAVRNEGDR